MFNNCKAFLHQTLNNCKSIKENLRNQLKNNKFKFKNKNNSLINNLFNKKMKMIKKMNIYWKSLTGLFMIFQKMFLKFITQTKINL